MKYSYSRLALCWLLFCSPQFVELCSAQELIALNASTNLTIQVSSRAGLADVSPQAHQQWPIFPGETVSNLVSGTNALTFVAVAGHHYAVTLDHFGAVSVNDSTPYNMSYFWVGFAFTFCLLLATWPVAWLKKVVADDWSTEA